MLRILIIGSGGFVGAILRYIISGLSIKYLGNTFPFGTLLVNIIGGLLIGFIMEASASFWTMSADFRMFLTVGLLGGFTTFSTFSFETVGQLSNGNYFLASLNIILNVFLCIFGTLLGRFLAQMA